MSDLKTAIAVLKQAHYDKSKDLEVVSRRVEIFEETSSKSKYDLDLDNAREEQDSIRKEVASLDVAIKILEGENDD